MGMGTRRRRQRQERLWISHNKLAKGPGHPFYARVNELLESKQFDECAEKECARFYADDALDAARFLSDVRTLGGPSNSRISSAPYTLSSSHALHRSVNAPDSLHLHDPLVRRVLSLHKERRPFWQRELVPCIESKGHLGTCFALLLNHKTSTDARNSWGRRSISPIP